MHRPTELIPALLLAGCVSAIIFLAQLLPFGQAMLLVRIKDTGTESALMAAAQAHSALVGIPAPGFAVLYGRAEEVRKTSGIAVIWKGKPPCSSS